MTSLHFLTLQNKIYGKAVFFLQCIIPLTLYDINENHTCSENVAFGRRTWEEKNAL